MSPRAALAPAEFVEWLRREGSQRYHDSHPYHRRMHQGQLTREQLQQWVVNRYYYQTRIPIKDALILSKSDSPVFRRTWIHRIVDHDGAEPGQGGLALWLQLAEAVGLEPERVQSCRDVLPGVRFACDAYVQLVRDLPLTQAVASSLTEFFAPDLMSQRIAAWEAHYPWVSLEKLGYFRARIGRARCDADEAMAFVTARAETYSEQAACVAALIRKTQILWGLLDALQAVFGGPAWDSSALAHDGR